MSIYYYHYAYKDLTDFELKKTVPVFKTLHTIFKQSASNFWLDTLQLSYITKIHYIIIVRNKFIHGHS